MDPRSPLYKLKMFVQDGPCNRICVRQLPSLLRTQAQARVTHIRSKMMLTIPIKIFQKRRSWRREYHLYIAYYYRTPTPSNPVRYHTALVLLPAPVARSNAKSDTEIQSDCESPPSSAPPSPSTPTFAPAAWPAPIISNSASPTRPTFVPPPAKPTYNSTPIIASHTTVNPPKTSKTKKATKFHAVNIPVNENGRGRVIWQNRVESDFPHELRTNLRSRLACLMLVGTVSSKSRVERTLKKAQANKYADEFPNYTCATWLSEALSMLIDEKVIDPLSCPPAEFWEVGAQYADKWKGQVVENGMAIPSCDRDGNEISTPLAATQE